MNAITATWLDHVLVAALAVVLPTLGWMSIRKIRAAIANGIPYTARVRDYRNNMLILWSVTGVMLAIWFAAGRDAAALGLGIPKGTVAGQVMAVALFALIVAYSVGLLRKVQRSAETADLIIRATREFSFAMPHTRRDLRWFYGLSATAGITEELLYRGFLLAYLSVFFPAWFAVLLSAVIFGAAHAYQGPKGMVQVTFLGAAFAIMYLVSGSLLLPIVAHIAVDVLNGTAMQYAYSGRDNDTTVATPSC